MDNNVIKEALVDDKRWEDYDTILCPDGQVIDMQKLLDDLERAKAALCHLQPFFGEFVGRLRPVYTFRIETQATDGKNLLINPQFTYNMSFSEKVFVLGHEIMHCVLNHLRRGKANGWPIQKTNIAADYECNITLSKERDCMGIVDFNTIKNLGGLIDKKYIGWGFEKIYNDCSQSSYDETQGNKEGENNNQNQSQSQNGQGGNGNGNGNGGGGSNGKQGVVAPEDCAPMGNVGAYGKEPGGMVDSQTANKIAEAEGYDKISSSDTSTENEWKDASIKAMNKFKDNMPGGLVSKIESLYKVSHDWKKELRKIIGMAISPEDKRQAYANKNTLIVQSRIARTDKDRFDNLDYMMVWIDSSGSMSDDMLRRVLSEVYYIALVKKPIKLVIVQCDTKIQNIKEYRNIGELKKDMVKATVKGRGGTDLRPCWDLLLKDPRYNRKAAELVMVFTDGYLNQYKRNPRMMKNLCWVVIDNPQFELQYKDINTKVIRLDSKSIR